ncbi:MAG: flagellar hook basal-body protein [Pseudomonadota bacterium]|nr:flagellar hook basal-body protein [Pseudomonadota bacterium]
MFAIIKTGLDTANKEISVVSNNIANANSTGFKKSRADFDELFSIIDEQRNSSLTGLGSRSEDPKRLHAQGSLKQTGGALDLAISGIGLFVLGASTENGEASYTRDGAFQIDQTETIVTTDGAPVIGVDNQPIRVPFSLQLSDGNIEYLSEVKVSANGRIEVSYDKTKDLEVGQFLLAQFDDESALKSIGNNRYIATDRSGNAQTGSAMTAGFGEVLAGSLEMSNVNITEELVALIRAQQSFNGSARLMQAEIEVTKKFTS